MANSNHIISGSNTPVILNAESPEGINGILSGFEETSGIFILVDENTIKHCLPLLSEVNISLDYARVLTMPAGEMNKTLDTARQLWNRLMEYGADRNSLLLNLGGGVVTDMGGFVASLFKRGIPFVNIPTSLLAMVDASLGGKTGVDFDGIKNQIGVFADPKAVFIHPPFLKTLSKRQLTNGLAEVIKAALIADREFFEWIDDMEISAQYILEEGNPDTTDIIMKSVKIKESIVQSDPREKSIRKILNFGHTLGHAIESLSMIEDADPLLHGEAIAIGMMIEARISAAVNGLSKHDLHRVNRVLSRYVPSKSYSGKEELLLDYMFHDKKNHGSEFRLSLLSHIGTADFNIPVSAEIIRECI